MNSTLWNMVKIIMTVSILTGCNNKTDNKNTTNITSKQTVEHNEIDITEQIQNVDKKEKSYKTVSFYNKNKKVRKQRIRECKKMKEKTLEVEKDCHNAKRSLQLSKRKNSNAFIDQNFL